MSGDACLVYLIGSAFLSGGLGTYLNDSGVGAMCFGACLILGALFSAILWGSKT